MANIHCKVIVFLLVVYLQFINATPRKSSQTCDATTCCPNKVCELKGNGQPRCSYATSCDQLQCPQGFVCGPHRHYTPRKTPGNSTRNYTRHRYSNRVECRVDCTQVNCPNFLECRERGRGISSYAVCKQPRRCSNTTCPPNTVCRKGSRSKVVCVADSCSDVDCGNNAVCEEGSAAARVSKASNTTSAKEYTPALKHFLRYLKKSRGKRTHSNSNSNTNSKSSGASRKQVVSLGVCLPQCNDNVCPLGLVCEERKLEVRCRAPRNCDELNCPAGQECEIVGCGKYQHRHHLHHFHSHIRTHTRSKYILRCVNITTPSIVPTSSSQVISSTSSIQVATTSVATTSVVTTSSIATTSISSIDTTSIATTSSVSTSSIATTSVATTSIATSTSNTLSPSPPLN